MTKYAKFFTALAGVVGVAISEGLFHGSAAQWASIVVAALTSAGVYLVPNSPTPTPTPTPSPGVFQAP